MLKTLAALCLGASLGACLRWLLGQTLNAFFPLIPFGTLAANLLGGFCMGVAMGFFAAFPSVGPEWRIFIITGFLGALTTFSTFSAEVVTLMQEQRYYWTTAAIALHLCGSLLMTFCGLGAFSLWKVLFR